MNPQMFEQMRNNMSHSDAKMGAQRMASMSDQELREYARMAGMPGMSPEMLRMSAQMMANMDGNEFNQYKNMAGSMGFPGASTPQAGNTSTSTASYNRTQSTPTSEPQKTSSNFPKIESLKAKGNDFFKAGDLDQAGATYFEAILEVEEFRIKNSKYESSELTTLEVSCRLNYATVKSKQQEWDICMEQAQKVLKYGENGKALFRLGQAQYHQGNKKEAVRNLGKASKLLTTDSSVKELLDKCEAELKSAENKDSSPTKKEEIPKTKPAQEEKPKSTAFSQQQEPKSEDVPTQSGSGQTKLKKKAAGGGLEPEFETNNHKATSSSSKDSYSIYEDAKRSTSEPTSERTSKQNKTEVVIEEERKEPQRQATSESNPADYSNLGGMDADKIKMAKEGLANMSPDQMKMATDFMKNADPSFIKQIMKQQTGMEMSDEQINMMKNMMTPEMLQYAAKNPDIAAGVGATNRTSSQPNTSNSISQPNPTGFPSFPAGTQPDLGNLMNNPDMINNMMKNLSKNPEMLKNMSKMLGDNNPLSKLLENRSPEEIEKMMGSMQKIFGVFQKVSPVIVFFRKYWKHMLGLLAAYIIYKYAL